MSNNDFVAELWREWGLVEVANTNTPPRTPPRTTRQTIQSPPPLVRHTQQLIHPIGQEEMNLRNELFHTLIEQAAETQTTTATPDILSIEDQDIQEIQ
jgi:hypothetical protein